MKKILTRAGFGVLALFLILQLVPIERNNPTVTQEMPAPNEVRDILKRSCYDCHSNQTVWPWYSHLAPVKFMVQHHVDEGRAKLNFSTWDQPQGEEQGEAPEEIMEVIDKGEMPTWDYLLMHGNARLSQKDIATLRAWAATMGEGAENGEHGENGERTPNGAPTTQENGEDEKNTGAMKGKEAREEGKTSTKRRDRDGDDDDD